MKTEFLIDTPKVGELACSMTNMQSKHCALAYLLIGMKLISEDCLNYLVKEGESEVLYLAFHQATGVNPEDVWGANDMMGTKKDRLIEFIKSVRLINDQGKVNITLSA